MTYCDFYRSCNKQSVEVAVQRLKCRAWVNNCSLMPKSNKTSQLFILQYPSKIKWAWNGTWMTVFILIYFILFYRGRVCVTQNSSPKRQYYTSLYFTHHCNCRSCNCWMCILLQVSDIFDFFLPYSKRIPSVNGFN